MPQSLNIAIWGYASNILPTWDPDTTEIGLPGSEECAVYASQELARRGHRVTVFMNPHQSSRFRNSHQNPRWLHAGDYMKSMQEFDFAILWRHNGYYLAKQKAKYVVYWGHDTPDGNQRGLKFPEFDGLILLSQHHLTQMLHVFPNLKDTPVCVSGNGYLPQQFDRPLRFKNPYSIGYYSNYSRGLEVLLLVWPRIKEEFPDATLDVYYGREHWGTMSQKHLDSLVYKLNTLPGVTEHGKVGHLQLAEAMCTTSVWAYPHIGSDVNSGETFCITAVKTQAAGSIPVVTRAGALKETVKPGAPSIEVITDNNHVTDYYNLLTSVLHQIENKTIEERKGYIQFAQQFTWEQCINKWLDFYKLISSK